jgi:hypothetical protein
MEKSTEECTVRFMESAKVCVEALTVLSKITLKVGWEGGPLSADALSAVTFIIGARLSHTSNEYWNDLSKQAAAGQTFALRLICSKMEAQLAIGIPIESYSRHAFNSSCIVCGIWIQISERILPGLLLPEQTANKNESGAHDPQRRVLQIVEGFGRYGSTR